MGKALDKTKQAGIFAGYINHYYRGCYAAFGKAEGFDGSYVRKMALGKRPVNKKILPLLGIK